MGKRPLLHLGLMIATVSVVMSWGWIEDDRRAANKTQVVPWNSRVPGPSLERLIELPQQGFDILSPGPTGSLRMRFDMAGHQSVHLDLEFQPQANGQVLELATSQNADRLTAPNLEQSWRLQLKNEELWLYAPQSRNDLVEETTRFVGVVPTGSTIRLTLAPQKLIYVPGDGQTVSIPTPGLLGPATSDTPRYVYLGIARPALGDKILGGAGVAKLKASFASEGQDAQRPTPI